MPEASPSSSITQLIAVIAAVAVTVSAANGDILLGYEWRNFGPPANDSAAPHPETGFADADELRKQALFFRPVVILCGASAYPRAVNSGELQGFAEEVDAPSKAEVRFP